MFKKKYRIREYIRADGRSSYYIEKRFFLFFWEDVPGFSVNSLNEAKRKIEELYSREIVMKKTHY